MKVLKRKWYIFYDFISLHAFLRTASHSPVGFLFSLSLSALRENYGEDDAATSVTVMIESTEKKKHNHPPSPPPSINPGDEKDASRALLFSAFLRGCLPFHASKMVPSLLPVALPSLLCSRPPFPYHWRLLFCTLATPRSSPVFFRHVHVCTLVSHTLHSTFRCCPPSYFFFIVTFTSSPLSSSLLFPLFVRCTSYCKRVFALAHATEKENKASCVCDSFSLYLVRSRVCVWALLIDSPVCGIYSRDNADIKPYSGGISSVPALLCGGGPQPNSRVAAGTPHVELSTASHTQRGVGRPFAGRLRCEPGGTQPSVQRRRGGGLLHT